MSKKKTGIIVGLVGAGVLAASAQFYKQVQERKQKEAALAQVRAFFADLGEVATVFIYEAQSNGHQLTGGVVMEAGPVYLFENQRGQITYREEA